MDDTTPLTAGTVSSSGTPTTPPTPPSPIPTVVPPEPGTSATPAAAAPVPPLAVPATVPSPETSSQVVSTPTPSAAPTTPTSVPVPAAAPVTPPADTSGKKRVLIIEDERPLAHALELKINHEGYDTHVSLTGADGLREALTGAYAIILLDLIMPELDGFSLLEKLHTQGIKTPVLVLSNLGQEEDKAKAKMLGAVDYFVKANTPILDIVKRMKEAMGS